MDGEVNRGHGISQEVVRQINYSAHRYKQAMPRSSGKTILYSSLLIKERSKMKNTGTTAVSGCLIWLILITIVGTCVMPVFFVAASLSSFSEFAIQTTGGWLCPEGTTPQRHTYATT